MLYTHGSQEAAVTVTFTTSCISEASTCTPTAAAAAAAASLILGPPGMVMAFVIRAWTLNNIEVNLSNVM